MNDQAELRRLGAAVHNATRHIASNDSAEQLYRDAAAVTEQRIPGPLGVALAAVLAEAAEHRRLSRRRGSLGAPNSMLALADAVLHSEVCAS